MTAQGTHRRGLLGKLGLTIVGLIAIGSFVPTAEANHRHHRYYCRHHGWTQTRHHHPRNYVPAYGVAPVVQPGYGGQPNYSGPSFYGYGIPY